MAASFSFISSKHLSSGTRIHLPMMRICPPCNRAIELGEKRNNFLQDIANTVHLLIDDSDMVRNALDTLGDREQSITIKLDKAVHSPTQNQNTDSEQENGD